MLESVPETNQYCSKEGNVSTSKKQQEPLVGFNFMSDRHRIKSQTNSPLCPTFVVLFAQNIHIRFTVDQYNMGEYWVCLRLAQSSSVFKQNMCIKSLVTF